MVKNWLEELPPSNNESEASLWLALSGDDLTATLKGHLAIENLLEQLIVHHMPQAAVLFDGSFMFQKKVTVLRRLKAIPKHVASMLQTINGVRNEFGHEPGLVRFAPEHWQKVVTNFRKQELDFIELLLHENGLSFVSVQSPAMPMRLAIFVGFAAVHEILQNLKATLKPIEPMGNPD